MLKEHILVFDCWFETDCVLYSVIDKKTYNIIISKNKVFIWASFVWIQYDLHLNFSLIKSCIFIIPTRPCLQKLRGMLLLSCVCWWSLVAHRFYFYIPKAFTYTFNRLNPWCILLFSVWLLIYFLHVHKDEPLCPLRACDVQCDVLLAKT